MMTTSMAASDSQEVETFDANRTVRPVAVWNMARSAFLIASLQTQADKGNRSDNIFKKHSWEVVVKEFNKHFNVQYDKYQLKAHFHWLRTQYLIVREVRQQSGFGWNQETGAVEAPDSVWTEYLKSHPKAKAYKDRSFPLYNEVERLIAGTLAPGAHRKSSTKPESSNARPSTQQSGSVDIEIPARLEVDLQPRTGAEPIQGDGHNQPFSACSPTPRASPRRSVPSSPGVGPSEENQVQHATRGPSEALAVRRGPSETIVGDGRTGTRVGQKRERSPTSTSMSTRSHRSRSSWTDGSVALAEAIQASVTMERENGVRRLEEMRMRTEQMRLQHEYNKARMECFPNMKQAMKVFWEVVAHKFADDKDRLGAAKLLRNEENAAFFLALPEDMQSYWLKQELGLVDSAS